MDPLEQEIQRYVGAGYRMVARGETSAQMVRPKNFNLTAAMLWLMVFGIGVLVYLAYYLSKADETVYLSVTGGVVLQQHTSSDRGQRCSLCGHENSTTRTTCKQCRKPLVRLIA